MTDGAGSPIEELRLARATELVDEDGRLVSLSEWPGLPATETDALATELGVRLPRELRDLLAETACIEVGPFETIDFTGRRFSYEDRDIFPVCLPLAGDGFGNHWVLDLASEDSETASVYYASHDAPVVLLQSRSLGAFLHEVFRLLTPPHASLINDVHDDLPYRVWRKNPGTVPHARALATDDAEVRAFAETLDDRFVLVDLRAAPVGMGFSWGRYGPKTRIRRHGRLPLFAYAPPDRKSGLLARLFRG